MFTLGLFANYFSLKSLSLSLKSHMNVLCALKLTELWNTSLLFDLNYKYINGKMKIALLMCYGGSVGPGSPVVSVENAVTVLRPKAVISVGACSGLSPEKTKLGDVVVSSKLTTYTSKVVMSDQEQSAGLRTYVSKRFLDVIKNCADG